MFDEKKNRYDIKILSSFIRNDVIAAQHTETVQEDMVVSPKPKEEEKTVATNSVVMQKLNGKIEKYKTLLPTEIYNSLRYGTLSERLDIVQSLLDTNDKTISVVELAVIKQYIVGLTGEIDISRRDNNEN